MTDRRKAIEELERCVEHIRYSNFEKIPFWGNCQIAMMYSIALLKEQEPRILSLEEAIEGGNGLEIDPYVFVEIKGREDIFIGAVNDASHYNYPNLSFDVNQRLLEECFQIIRGYKGSTASKIYLNTDYMKIVRCWTHKPSKEQRNAVKWDDT